ncbi:MAG: hypothetical protein ACW99G_01200 [Candidatus Thorarchaeota archaeon]
MKKILVVSGLLLIFLLWYRSRPQQTIYFIEPLREIQPEQIDPAIAHIQSINAANSKIVDIYAEVDLTIEKQIAYRIQCELNYEKDLNFRIIGWSKIRKEIDIGSNDQKFWFWSARMKPSALYYCPQSNISRNRLRTVFHPLWIMETLSIGKIDLANSKILEQGDNWAVIQYRTGTSGNPVIKVTLISKRSTIIGHYIFNSKGKMIISTEIEEYQNVDGHLIPLKMKTIWYEENVTLFWSFRNIKVNLGINQEKWKMPNIRKQIDISL